MSTSSSKMSVICCTRGKQPFSCPNPAENMGMMIPNELLKGSRGSHCFGLRESPVFMLGFVIHCLVIFSFLLFLRDWNWKRYFEILILGFCCCGCSSLFTLFLFFFLSLRVFLRLYSKRDGVRITVLKKQTNLLVALSSATVNDGDKEWNNNKREGMN